MNQERIDEIGFGGLKLIQNEKEFCYGVDSVILSHYASKLPINDGLIFDLGTGNGVIPLILSKKMSDARILGVEFQEGSYDLAQRNRKLNKLEDRINFIKADVKDYEKWGIEFSGKADMVVTNPPYFKQGAHLINDEDALSLARHETTAGLRDFMNAANWLLKKRGSLYMINRPSRLIDICEIARDIGLEPREIRFISPNKNKAPNIMLIHMIKGGGHELRFLDPLYVYDEAGNYTEEILRCYEEE